MKKTVRNILNGLSMPVFIVDPKERISFLNKVAKIHYKQAKTGVKFNKIITSEKCQKALRRVLEGSEKEIVNVTLQEVFPTSFRISLSRFDMEKESQPSCVLSFEDTSHIQEATQMRHDFVANVSHELRSPLTALTGFVETLQGSASEDIIARTRFLDLMATETDRMTRLVGELLSLSKFQASERHPATGQVNIKPLLNNVLQSLMGVAQAGNIAIKTNIPDGLPCVIGDNDELTQVFVNLIENAINYSAKNTEITLTAALEGEKELSIAIKDQGEGIDRVHIPRLTERFYRVDKGRSRAKGGTGLGLAIVKHILIRHRGRLRISSQLGRGSQFIVYLPIL